MTKHIVIQVVTVYIKRDQASIHPHNPPPASIKAQLLHPRNGLTDAAVITLQNAFAMPTAAIDAKQSQMSLRSVFIVY
jgi:hypothetical protein